MGTKKRAYGSDVQLLAAFESTYGTPPDGSGGDVYKKLLFKDTTLGAEAPLGYDPILGQGRDAQDPFHEAEIDGGDIGIPLDLRATGFWLKGLLGAPDTTDNSDGTYTHEFTSGGDLPSLSLELGHMALATKKFYLHQGVKIETLSFDMARSGPANATIGVVAQGETTPSSAADDTPGSYALKRFSQSTGSISIGGSQVANVTGGALSFSNNLDRVETIRSDELIDGADETEATAEGSITARLSTDTTLSSAVAAKTPVSLELGYSIPGAEGYELTFTFPRVFLPKPKNSISGPSGIQVDYNWRAAKDDTAGYMMLVTLTNDVASY